jgi:hypothetical protein
MSVLLEIGLWLLKKIGVALAVVAVGLLVGGVYLYLSDELRTESMREGALESLRERETELQAAITTLETRVGEMRVELDRQRQRAETARRLLKSLEEMNSLWDWLFGSAVDTDELAKKKTYAADQESDALGRVGALAEAVGLAATDYESTVTELATTKDEIARVEQLTSPVLRYGRDAWKRYRWPLAIALFGYFFGPTIWKVTAFYALGPLVGRARPISICPVELPAIEVSRSRVSEAVHLGAGDAIFLRERFLQASDEILKRRTRFVLDWRIPVTCAACGLIELVELENSGDGDASVTVSTQDDTTIELGVIEIPAGASIVLRPSFLAGLMLPQGHRVSIRRHWRFFHLQSWLTLQFRFFEFVGPCRIVVAGSRGIRAEVLGGPNGRTSGRRTNQDSTIGFTPDLHYKSVRAETFWAYYRDRNPLFDDLFRGHGTFLCQEVATDGPGGKGRKFWSTLWNGVLKIFGM